MNRLKECWPTTPARSTPKSTLRTQQSATFTFAAMMFAVPMKRYLSTTCPYLEKLLASFLLVGLIVTSSVALGATNSADQKEEGESGPDSLCSRATLFREYALTTLPGQRTASDIFKKNSAKHPVNYGGLALRESAAPAATGHEIIVATDRSILYLSFRVSPPRGRAPPASA